MRCWKSPASDGGSPSVGLDLLNENPHSAYRMAWNMVNMKSRIERVNASMRPRLPWAIVIYVMMRESDGMDCHWVSQERKELTILSMPMESGAT